jgi:tetratricopeptide (TPR) repeat protein
LRTLLAVGFAERDSARAWDAFECARDAGERLLRAAPDDAEDAALLARVLAARAAARPGSVPQEEIRRAYSRALGLDSTSATVLELAVQGYQQAGLSREAHAAAVRATRLYPEFARPMADLGRMAFTEGRYSDAVDTLALAVRLDWHGEPLAEAAARANLALALWALGRREEARREARRALDLSPDLEAARAILDPTNPSSQPRGRRLRP